MGPSSMPWAYVGREGSTAATARRQLVDSAALASGKDGKRFSGIDAICLVVSLWISFSRQSHASGCP